MGRELGWDATRIREEAERFAQDGKTARRQDGNVD
jgi:hypothetical protein